MHKNERQYNYGELPSIINETSYDAECVPGMGKTVRVAMIGRNAYYALPGKNP